MTFFTSTKHGFTLIEILITITIIGILTALITTNLAGGRERASDSQKKQNLEQLKVSLHLYYTDYGHFPPPGNGLNFLACGNEGTTNCTDSFTAGGKEYMAKLPKSGNQNAFRYYSCNSGDDFRLKINLTNSSDAEIADSQARCPADTCITDSQDGCPADTCTGQSLSFGTSDYVLCGN